MPRALISVSDKRGVVEFAQALETHRFADAEKLGRLPKSIDAHGQNLGDARPAAR